MFYPDDRVLQLKLIFFVLSGFKRTLVKCNSGSAGVGSTHHSHMLINCKCVNMRLVTKCLCYSCQRSCYKCSV